MAAQRIKAGSGRTKLGKSLEPVETSRSSALPRAEGFVEGCVSNFIHGWAVAADGSPVSISVCDVAGGVLVRESPTEYRPDIARLGFVNATCGFRVAVPGVDRLALLRVFANDVELVGSPVAVGPGLFDGALEVRDGIACGWVSERRIGFAGALVEFRDQDNALLGATEALVDFEAEGDARAKAQFAIPLSPIAYGRTDLIVRAIVNGLRVAETLSPLRLEGFLDALTPAHCSGWLLSPDAPGRVLAVEVYRDGVLVGEGRCDLPRPDVRERYRGSWRVGFHITFDPSAHNDASDWTPVYSFRLTGTDTELFEGPFAVEDRGATVSAVRRISRWAQADGSLDDADHGLLQRALNEFLARRRLSEERPRRRVPGPTPTSADRRLNIIIPIYRGLEVTRACIDSVLAWRDLGRDALVLVNDCSPEPGMAEMLERFAQEQDVFLLTNTQNQGFVRSANRGMAFFRRGDVLLLNSDTRVFAGVLDELCRVAVSSSDIGTVTAMSNNATIFSYPHPTLPNAELDDIGWEDVAALAQDANPGLAIDAPTGHGFCLLIRREVIARIGMLDEAFGRGYGEENDFCQRAADLGFRNVAAAGAFVEHRESVSFAGEREGLRQDNLARLGRMYPEYTAGIMSFERTEGLRRARWPLDSERLRRASLGGTKFTLVVTNWLSGGAQRAVGDIDRAVGYGEAQRLSLTGRSDGMIELECKSPAVRAVFAPDETEPLFAMLSATRIVSVLVHQVLGFSQQFISALAAWSPGRHVLYYAHDYYPLCPRVTMIDAAGNFCGLASADVCTRCVSAGGKHEADRMRGVTPARHRAVLGRLLGAVHTVVAPSASAGEYYQSLFPDISLSVAPHPETELPSPDPQLRGEGMDVVLLGAIGPHKGSAKLLEIARLARLSHPHLRFRVVGHTDIDADLRALSNVTITGAYEPWELPGLLADTRGGLALFLHVWPETWSYTLSEAVACGLWPIVPDIGAPAERVREADFGTVFPFPINASEVLAAIDSAMEEAAGPRGEAKPADFQRPEAVALHRALLGISSDAEEPVAAKRSARMPEAIDG